MVTFTYSELQKKVEQGLEGTGTCISVNGARIIIPTACKEVIGFTNPDDLDVGLLERWKKGERGPEFENQKLQPGDCLVMYNNGRNINQILAQYPDWHKSAQGIKEMIERLYTCADVGGKNTEPAIWNSDLRWAQSVHLTTTAGQEITADTWAKNAGVAIESIKAPKEQKFVHVEPGDKLVSPDGMVQTAGAMSAVAVEQPDGTWNIVQLNAKGYTVVKENHPEKEKHDAKDSSKIGDLLSKAKALEKASAKVRASIKNPEALTYRDMLNAEAPARAKVTAAILRQRYGIKKQK